MWRRRTRRAARTPRRATPRASTAGARWVRRWSNQCAVDSCSARKRVIGGSPSRPDAAHARSTTAPAPDATARGTDRVGSGTPAARQMRVSSSATVRGSPLRHHEGLTADVVDAVEGRDQGVGGVVDVRACRSAPCHRRSARAGRTPPARRCVRPAGCRPVPRPGVGGSATTASAVVDAAEDELLGHRLAARVVAVSALGVGRVGVGADEWLAEVGDRRRRHVDQARDAVRAHARPARSAVPPTLTDSNSCPVPVTETFAARCTTASAPRIARDTASASRMSPRTCRQALMPSPRCSVTTSSPRSTQALRHRCTEQAGAAGDEHPHGVPVPLPASTSVGPSRRRAAGRSWSCAGCRPAALRRRARRRSRRRPPGAARR